MITHSNSYVGNLSYSSFAYAFACSPHISDQHYVPARRPTIHDELLPILRQVETADQEAEARSASSTCGKPCLAAARMRVMRGSVSSTDGSSMPSLRQGSALLLRLFGITRRVAFVVFFISSAVLRIRLQRLMCLNHSRRYSGPGPTNGA